MATNMVCAYYDRTVDGAIEFAGLQIASDPSFDRERNRYDVLRVNMQGFLSAEHGVVGLLARLQRFLCAELARSCPDLLFLDKGYADLVMVPLKSSGAIPGVVVELKWGATPEAAVAQIRDRGYDRFFRGTSAEGNVVLCGIAYDPMTKTHSCRIER